MAINLVKEYQKKVAERYSKESLTASAASQEYKFTGVKEIEIFSVDTAPIGDYTRNGTSRYGTPNDLTDSIQTMVINNDKAFTYTIDKGDEAQQYNIKASNRALKREIDERVNPYLDQYNLEKWAEGAGSHVVYSALNKNSVIDITMDATEQLDEALAPEAGRTMFVTNQFYKFIKESPNWVYTNQIEGKVIKGMVGQLDGMTVKKVPNKYMPAGVAALVADKNAILSPMQLKNYKIHVDPIGVNGDVTEGRFIHDAFVIDSKAKGVCAIVDSGNCAANLTVAVNTTSNVGSVAGTFDKAFYTLDGSDPRCSGTAVQINSNKADINTAGAVELRAVGFKSGKSVGWTLEAQADC